MAFLGIRKKSPLERSLPKPVQAVIGKYIGKVQELDKQRGLKGTKITWDQLAEKAVAYAREKDLAAGADLTAKIDAIYQASPAHIQKELLENFVEDVATSLGVRVTREK